MRTSFLALALLAILSLTNSCQLYQNPLTDRPSKDINTWLLGVWEYEDEAGKTYRIGVMPLTADRLTIWGREMGSSKTVKYEAWISRVGSSKFLSMKSLTSTKEIPEGTFVFLHYQVIDQTHVVARGLQLDSPEDASSKALRREVRAKLEDRTLLPDQGSTWTRISEVYWQAGEDPLAQPMIPPRFPPEPPLVPLEVAPE